MTKRNKTGYMEQTYDEIEVTIRRLRRLFDGAAGLLLIEILSWTVELA